MPRLDAILDLYDRTAGAYEQHAALETEVGRRLLERVAFARSEPAVVLDLGCGTGIGLAALKKSVKKAQVVGLDVSGAMLARAGKKSRLTRPIRLLEASMEQLPLSARTVDLVFSNLAMPLLEGFGPLFDEVRRVLKPDGMFLFSTFGPASFEQLSQAAGRCLPGFAVPRFPDLLEVGDALTAAGFMNPVMDVDHLTLHYPGLEAMASELETTGASLLFEDWGEPGNFMRGLESEWMTMDGGQRYPLDFEIIYGAAFGPPEGQPRRTPDGEIATFSVDSLVKSRNLGYD